MRLLSATTWLTTLSLAALAGACSSGSDGNGSSQTLNSGVEKSKTADQVTNDEAEAVCEAFASYYDSRVNSRSFQLSICRWAAVYAVASVSAEGTNVDLNDLCDLAYDACVDCLDNPGTEGCEDFPTFDFALDEPCTDAEPPESCDATVGEVEACLKAEVDAIVDVFDGAPSCGGLTESQLEQVNEEGIAEPDLPAACVAIEDTCPDVTE